MDDATENRPTALSRLTALVPVVLCLGGLLAVWFLGLIALVVITVAAVAFTRSTQRTL